MAKSRRICGQQDCNEYTSRANYPLCVTHHHDFKAGIIDECPNHPGRYKPTRYSICRTCYEDNRNTSRETNSIAENRQPYNAGGWEKPYIESEVTPPVTEAVSRARENMNMHSAECVNSEENTKQYLVEPILRGLGWQFDDPQQVQKEYRPAKDPRPGKRGIAVDIALVEEGVPIAIVEAKRLDRDLDRDYDTAYKKQIDEYASYMERGTAALTNGKFWHVARVHNGVTGEWEVIDISRGPQEEVAKSLQSALGRDVLKRLDVGTRDSGSIQDRLKAYRTSERQRRNIPAFTVFNNETIKLITLKKPRSEQELKSIEGIGPKRLKEHGAAILAIVNG